MCFIQLSLWNIPAAVIVGDTLANEVRECFYTPAHRMGAWEYRLELADRRDRQSAEPEKATADDLASPEPAKTFQMWWIF
jgi:hypothetical protein